MKWWLALGILLVGCRTKDDEAVPIGPIRNADDDIHITPSPQRVDKGPPSKPNSNGISIQAKKHPIHGSKIVITFENHSNHPVTIYTGGDCGFQCEITSVTPDVWRDKGNPSKFSPKLDPAQMTIVQPSKTVSVTVYPIPIVEPVKSGEFIARLRYDDTFVNQQAKALGWKTLSTVGRTESIPIYLRSDSSDFLWPSPTK